VPRPAAMRFVFAYDLPSTPAGDRRRARLARYLESLGLRVQGSVFELELAPEVMPRIYKEILDRLDPSDDSLRIYSLCHACNQRTVRIGKPAACEHTPLLFF
jgi:CRISPR-associated endoribonuclease Cas2